VHGFTAVDVRRELLPEMHAAAEQGWQTYRQLSVGTQELYVQGTLREAEAGAQIVHWPEMALFLPEEDEAEFTARIQQIAKDHGIYVVMAYALEFQDRSPFDNKLVILDPAGDIVLVHHKYGGAALDGAKPGDGILQTVETPFGTLSGIICNDTNHEDVVAQAGKNGTDILFAPSMEHEPIDPIHAHMAIYRAIENGVTLVRQADNGLSIATDPYGRLSATMDHFNNSERVMVAKVPMQSAFTIYPYIGDLFAWLSILGLIIITVVAITQGRKVKQEAGS
jgi:apolipoprotein N-acyltransferase